jgi:hypothetical protein
MMEVVSIFETSVSFYETTRRNVLEDSAPQKLYEHILGTDENKLQLMFLITNMDARVR